MMGLDLDIAIIRSGALRGRFGARVGTVDAYSDGSLKISLNENARDVGLFEELSDNSELVLQIVFEGEPVGEF